MKYVELSEEYERLKKHAADCEQGMMEMQNKLVDAQLKANGMKR